MALASTDDIAIRLGRDLTAAEAALADQTIAAVTAQIADAVDRDLDWAEALDPVPGLLKTLCVEKVIVVGSNPNSLANESQTLGAYSHSRTFQRSNDSGVFLTDAEQRMARLAVYGTNSGSASQESMIDREIDLIEGRDVDVDPVA